MISWFPKIFSQCNRQFCLFLWLVSTRQITSLLSAVSQSLLSWTLHSFSSVVFIVIVNELAEYHFGVHTFCQLRKFVIRSSRYEVRGTTYKVRRWGPEGGFRFQGGCWRTDPRHPSHHSLNDITGHSKKSVSRSRPRREVRFFAWCSARLTLHCLP